MGEQNWNAEWFTASSVAAFMRKAGRSSAFADDDDSLLLLRGLQSCNHVKDIFPRALTPWLPCEKTSHQAREIIANSAGPHLPGDELELLSFSRVQSDQLCHNAAVGPQAGWRRQRSRRHRRRHG